MLRCFSPYLSRVDLGALSSLVGLRQTIHVIRGRHGRVLLFTLVQTIDHDRHDRLVNAQRSHQIRMLVEDAIVHDITRAHAFVSILFCTRTRSSLLQARDHDLLLIGIHLHGEQSANDAQFTQEYRDVRH